MSTFRAFLKRINSVMAAAPCLRFAFKDGAVAYPLRGVVFDMDGTMTVPALDFGKMRRMLGIDDGTDIVEYLHSLEGDEREKAERAVSEVEEEGRANLQLMPGCQELLHLLSLSNIPFSILTRNNQEGINDFIRVLLDTPGPVGTNPFSIMIGRELQPAKPHPHGIRHIVAHWNADLGLGEDVTMNQVLMIGDGKDDMLCAARAGVASCFVHNGTNDHVKDALEEAGVRVGLEVHSLEEISSMLRGDGAPIDCTHLPLMQGSM